MFTIKDLIILCVVFGLFALIVEVLYLVSVKLLCKKESKTDVIVLKVVDTRRKKVTGKYRPELDFDLGIKKVDKLRMGDET